MSSGTLSDRFWSKVDKDGPMMPGMDTPCWVWTGSLDSKGYGQINSGGHSGKLLRTHRVAWFLVHGDWPKSSALCHRCDCKRCVRTDHLVDNGKSWNALDMYSKGKQGDRNLPKGEDHWKVKLTDLQVAEIRSAPCGSLEMAKRFGVSYSHIKRLRRGDSRV